MSKITPKNLSYDTTLPPFLQRLQANNSQDGRNEFQAARPKKARNAEEEVEDEPVYFDEVSGETLIMREWEERDARRVGGKDGEGEAGGVGEEVGGEARVKDGQKEKIAAIGVAKKRKAGKIVGVDGEDGVEEEEWDVVGEIKKVEKSGGKKVEKGKSAKKAKKIKLSFGDDE